MSMRSTLRRLGAVLLALASCRALGEESMPADPSLCVELASVVSGLPLPPDARPATPQPDDGCVFTTSLIEPQLFDFYTHQLQADGWQRVAPTEAMVTLPRQIWRRDERELIVECQGLNRQSRTMVSLILKDLSTDQ